MVFVNLLYPVIFFPNAYSIHTENLSASFVYSWTEISPMMIHAKQVYITFRPSHSNREWECDVTPSTNSGQVTFICIMFHNTHCFETALQILLCLNGLKPTDRAVLGLRDMTQKHIHVVKPVLRPSYIVLLTSEV